MTIEARRAGSARLSLAGEPDEPVWYDISLEHDGASVVAFSGAVTSIMGRALGHLLSQPAILRIEDGPTVEVTISALDGDHALLELTYPQRNPLTGGPQHP